MLLSLNPGSAFDPSTPSLMLGYGLDSSMCYALHPTCLFPPSSIDIPQSLEPSIPIKRLTPLSLFLNFPDFQGVHGFIIGDHSDMFNLKAKLINQMGG